MIGYYLLLYMDMAYVVGMPSLIVGSELGLRKVFSNANIIDINTLSDEMAFTKYLEFVYVDIGELDGWKNAA